MIQAVLAALLLAVGWQPAYLTEHPGRADLWVVATQDGLFSVERIAGPRDMSGCDRIGPGLNVTVQMLGYGDYLTDNYPTYGDGFLVEGQYDCWLRIQQQESSAPCFQTEGVCDVDGE